MIGRRGARELWFFASSLVSIALVYAYFHAKWRALGFVHRDYAFFAAQYRRLLDVPPWRGLSDHADGRNLFGFHGIDALPTLHHDIHLSPIKYLLAAIARPSGSLACVEVALALTHVAGLYYVLRRTESTSVIALACATLLSPIFLLVASFDLRPVIALTPIVWALAAAILTRAPDRHFFVIALAGLLVREEIAVLLAIAACILELDGRRDLARRLYIAAFAYAASFCLFLGRFSSFEHSFDARAVGVALVALAYPILATLRLAPRGRAHAVLLLALPFLAMMAERPLSRRAFMAAYPIAFLVSLVSAHAFAKKVDARVVSVLALAFATVSVALGVSEVARYRSLDRPAVWAHLDALPRGALLVTDVAHHSVLAGRDDLIVWKRLPATIEPSERRFFPASRARLIELLEREDALVVMSEDSFRQMSAALGDRMPRLAICEREPTIAARRCPLTARASP